MFTLQNTRECHFLLSELTWAIKFLEPPSGACAVFYCRHPVYAENAHIYVVCGGLTKPTLPSDTCIELCFVTHSLGSPGRLLCSHVMWSVRDSSPGSCAWLLTRWLAPGAVWPAVSARVANNAPVVMLLKAGGSSLPLLRHLVGGICCQCKLWQGH